MENIYSNGLKFGNSDLTLSHQEIEASYLTTSLINQIPEVDWRFNYQQFAKNEEPRRDVTQDVISFLEEKSAFDVNWLARMMGEDAFSFNDVSVDHRIDPSAGANTFCNKSDELQQLGYRTQHLTLHDRERHVVQACDNKRKPNMSSNCLNQTWEDNLEKIGLRLEGQSPKSWAEKANACPQANTPNRQQLPPNRIQALNGSSSKINLPSMHSLEKQVASSDITEGHVVRGKLMWEILQENVNQILKDKKEKKSNKNRTKKNQCKSLPEIGDTCCGVDTSSGEKSLELSPEVEDCEAERAEAGEESYQDKQSKMEFLKEADENPSAPRKGNLENCSSEKALPKNLVYINYRENQAHNTLHIHKIDKQKALWKELIEKEATELENQKNRQKWLRKDTEKNYRKKLEAERRARERLETLLEKRQEKEKEVVNEPKREKKEAKKPKKPQSTKLKHEKRKN